MNDIIGVKQALAANSAAVAEHLLPRGVKEGAEWRAGSIDGEKGRSLGVHLTGGKAGVWSDFSTGEGGDLLDLWVKTQKMSLSEAICAARDWLGMARPEPFSRPRRTFTRPPRPKCNAPVGAARDYLVRERKIPLEVLEKYKIGEQGMLIIFPFLLPDGELALAKARKAEAGAKPKPMAADCEPVLFGWQAIDPNAREVVITEGEIDALSWAAYGWPAMSIPFGGGDKGKQNWIESEFERMERFERIYLATDMDKGGNEAAKEIASRLGRHRCYRVATPFKDGNECRLNDVPKEVMDEAIRKAANLDPEGLRKPTDFREEVVHLFWPKEGAHVGYRTPYGALKDKLVFRPGEVTLWSGATGAGKSQLLSDCAVDWVKQGSRICISSLEMKGAQTLRRMCKQAGGIDQPTEKYIDAILQWLETGLLIYDKIGKAGAGSLIEIFEYAYSKYGCDQFIVDSLMRLGLAADDYSGQEKAVFQLLEWTIEKGVHLHLVAHSRKGGSQNGAPDTEDVKGTSEIGSNAANVITVWRNKDLERDVSALSQDDNSEEAREMWRTPGVICNLAKQRSGDFEGQIGLWFDKGTYRYHSFYELSFRDDRPLPKFFGRDYVSRTFRENESDNADSHIPF